MRKETYFVDTNFFLRFLLDDIESQHQESEELFIQAAKNKVKLLTSAVVIFEINWVLKSVYQFSKPQIILTLEKALKLKVKFPEKRIFKMAFTLYKTNNLSLGDCYNLVFVQERKDVEFKTFDKKLLRKFEKLKRS